MEKELTIRQYKDGHVSEQSDVIAEERDVEIVINQTSRLTVSLSPESVKAFAYGFLYTSGLITSMEDILDFKLSADRVEVSLKSAPEAFNLILSSGCGSGAAPDLDIEKMGFKKILYPDFDGLPSLYREFNGYSVVHEKTGGVHSAALTDGKEIRFFSEDIGRHNAVDKTVGKALLEGIQPGNFFLLVSGRISGEIVKKAFFAGIKAIISRSAPTCAAIKRARKINMGIIGFLRGKRFNIYT